MSLTRNASLPSFNLLLNEEWPIRIKDISLSQSNLNPSSVFTGSLSISSMIITSFLLLALYVSALVTISSYILEIWQWLVSISKDLPSWLKNSNEVKSPPLI